MTDNRRRVQLRWSGHELRFEGAGEGGPPVVIDGDSEEGPAPMEALLLSLGSCMAVDVKVILEKGRVDVRELEVDVEGERVADHPQRYHRIWMTFRLKGPGERDEGKIARAVELSRDKYCSVFHTLRADLEVEIRTERM